MQRSFRMLGRMLGALGATAACAGSFACGESFRAGVVLTFTGETPPAGQGYRISVLDPAGYRIGELQPVYVEATSGEQQVSVDLVDDLLFNESGTAVVRLYAEAVDSDTLSATISAKGGAVVEVAEGSIVEKSIALIADPAAAAEGSVGFVLDDSDTRLRVEVTSVPDGIVMTAYSKRGADDQDYIGQPSITASAVGRPANALASTSADPFEVLLTAEVMEQPEQMGLAYGWVVARAEVRDPTIEVVRVDGTLERMSSLVQNAQTHAGLAVSTSDPITHSEHVFNILAAEKQDFNDANTTADRAGIEDATGVAAYLDAVEAEAILVGESTATANPSAITDAAGCITATRAALQATLEAAASVASEASVDTAATVDATTDLGDGEHAACVAEEVRRVLTLRLGPP